MITYEKDRVIIPRKTWDKYKKDDYFKELFEVLQDSEELDIAIENSTEMIDLRDYDRKRREREIQNSY